MSPLSKGLRDGDGIAEIKAKSIRAVELALESTRNVIAAIELCVKFRPHF